MFILDFKIILTFVLIIVVFKLIISKATNISGHIENLQILKGKMGPKNFSRIFSCPFEQQGRIEHDWAESGPVFERTSLCTSHFFIS